VFAARIGIYFSPSFFPAASNATASLIRFARVSSCLAMWIQTTKWRRYVGASCWKNRHAAGVARKAFSM
jgi:hypothetical protein